METKEKNKTTLWLIVVAVLVFLAGIVANWDDFKTGFMAGYAGQAKPHP